MNLEQQVCSLDLAKRLKELGVPQDSVFYWDSTDPNNLILHLAAEEIKLPTRTTKGTYYSAFTVAELGEILPPLYLSMRTREDGWCLCPKSVADERAEFEDERVIRANTEADARAEMLIYLIENKLL